MKFSLSSFLCLLSLFFWGTPILAQEPPTFVESGGLVVIEAESAVTFGSWQPQTAIAGFTGANYLNYQGGNFFNSPGNSKMTYRVQITTTGRYRFQWRSRITTGNSISDNNDSWLRCPDASAFYAKRDASIVYPHGSGLTPNPDGSGSDGWFKVYQNNNGNWTWNSNTYDNNPHLIFVEFAEPGIYTIEVSGRSTNHAIDRMVLFASPGFDPSTALSTNNPESARLTTSTTEWIDTDLAIYPNPANDFIHLKFAAIPENGQLNITNNLGQRIAEIPVSVGSASEVSVDVSDYPTGIYLLRMIVKNMRYTGQFLKK